MPKKERKVEEKRWGFVVQTIKFEPSTGISPLTATERTDDGHRKWHASCSIPPVDHGQTCLTYIIVFFLLANKNDGILVIIVVITVIILI